MDVLPEWLFTSTSSVAAKAPDLKSVDTPAKPVVSMTKLISELSDAERVLFKQYRTSVKALEKHDAEVVAAGEHPSIRVLAIAYNAFARYSRMKGLVHDKSWFKKLKPEPPKVSKHELYNNAKMLIDEAEKAEASSLKLSNLGVLTGSALKPAGGEGSGDASASPETILKL